MITNDDGIRAPGIAAAAAALVGLGDLLIVAPLEAQNSMGRAYPINKMAGAIREVTVAAGRQQLRAFAVVGSPSQVVCHAVLELSPRRPDLCVSGINYGENVGRNLMASGTIGAAFEADRFGIPAIAMSLQVPSEPREDSPESKVDWRTAMHLTHSLANFSISRGFPKAISVLNVNVPFSATTRTPLRVTRQSAQDYYVSYAPDRIKYDEPNALHYRLEYDRATLDRDSDIHALCVEGLTSVSPLGWDMSARSELYAHGGEFDTALKRWVRDVPPGEP